MAELKVLIQGYAREEGDYESACSTVVLIKDGNKKIIVDPGMNKPLLLKALKNEKLTPGDIDFVFLTHYHFDHSLLAGIFNNAIILYADEAYDQKGKILEPEDYFSDDIEIINTPGHNSDCRSLIVNTEKEKVAVCEDVFWWMDGEERKLDAKSLIEKEDVYAKDMEKLKKSRRKIVKLADYFIPGHGEPFKIKTNEKNTQ